MNSYIIRLSIIFIVSLCLIDSVYATMWAYVPLSQHLQEADIVLTAKIVSIIEKDTIRFAIAKPTEILKGEWQSDSILTLQFYERRTDEVMVAGMPEILYDSAATYMLLFRLTNSHLNRVSMPRKIGKQDDTFIKDVKEILRIASINKPSQRALSYTNLLNSPYTKVRESAAWELGKTECHEALTGLTIALQDTSYWVFNNAAHGIYLLAEKGITSDTVIIFLKSLLNYSLNAHGLLKALAAQGGNSVIPYLRDYFIFCDRGKESVLETFAYLRDTTAMRFFRQAILSDLWRHLRETAVRHLDYFPPRMAIPTAIEALDDKNEYVRDSAIEMLETLTNNHFGKTDTIKNYFDREPARKKIIKKWENWYKDWQKEQIE